MSWQHGCAEQPLEGNANIEKRTRQESKRQGNTKGEMAWPGRGSRNATSGGNLFLPHGKVWPTEFGTAAMKGRLGHPSRGEIGKTTQTVCVWSKTTGNTRNTNNNKEEEHPGKFSIKSSMQTCGGSRYMPCIKHACNVACRNDICSGTCLSGMRVCSNCTWVRTCTVRFRAVCCNHSNGT